MAHWLPEEQQRLEAVALGVLAPAAPTPAAQK